MPRRHVHLDHAAGSWPKADGVLAAITRWYAELGVGAERGDSALTREVANEVDATRGALARRLGVAPARCAFTSGATESINLFLRACLAPGDHVLATATDHAAVVRPLVALRRERGLSIDRIDCDAQGRIDPQRVIDALARRPPRLVVLNHASNVTGAVLDAAPLIAAAHAHGARVLLDASQTIGVLDVALGADAVAGSAHKSLFGPAGLGFLAIAADLELAPQKQGGTGSSRALDEHPHDWPLAFEAGTPNTPAILGLGAALRWLATHDAAAARRRTLAAVDALRAHLLEHRGIACQSPGDGDARLPILSFTSRDHDPAELGALLDLAGFHVRTGHHCAPFVHAALGTNAAGTVRVSPGPFVSAEDLFRVASVLGPA